MNMKWIWKYIVTALAGNLAGQGFNRFQWIYASTWIRSNFLLSVFSFQFNYKADLYLQILYLLSVFSFYKADLYLQIYTWVLNTIE